MSSNGAPYHQAVCHACGRVVALSPLNSLESSVFFTIDDHSGADGRCPAVGDIVARNPPQPCDACGLAGARGKAHGIGGHMNDDETWPWCPGGEVRR